MSEFKKVGMALSKPHGKNGRQEEYALHERDGKLYFRYSGYRIGLQMRGLPMSGVNNVNDQTYFPVGEKGTFTLTTEKWAYAVFYDGREGGFGRRMTILDNVTEGTKYTLTEEGAFPDTMVQRIGHKWVPEVHPVTGELTGKQVRMMVFKCEQGYNEEMRADTPVWIS